MTKQIFLLSSLPIIVLAAFLAFMQSFIDVRHTQREWANFTAGRLLMVVDQIRSASTDSDQAIILAAASQAGLSVKLANLNSVASTTERVISVRTNLVSALTELTDDTRILALQVNENRVLTFSPRVPQNIPPLSHDFLLDLLQFLALAFPVLALSLYISHRITRPLTRFTEMAQRVSLQDTDMEAFSSGNVDEIQSLSDSLNAMRVRIRGMVNTRANMLRALGHDLRTPLTRLRMKAECCTDPELQRRMLRDIDMLSNMIGDAMVYLTNMSPTADVTSKADLTSLLQTLVTDFSDTGLSVSFSGPPRLPLTCKPRLLSRAITNLLDNASRYGKHVDVILYQGDTANEVLIDVCDDGPGLSDDLKKRALETFFKADSARPAMTRGGFGLGLPIANGVAKHHRGGLSLLDRKPHGLIARLTIRALDDVPDSQSGAA
ncbi:HAMP domain-containing histidine kinase (plasmid) [Phyllobacterium sp. 628]|uniref:HAMP domain-containing sensor histidine kinase n=1 Tax=Phyllobacterium sp. 628 TaxID=2718938 RepID=UPI00166226FA|nr:HAMP domain-containing sensor histidine kinase [Phyllobacterium sp. 628]QND54555.1 HAMP domain-containing histidine kinase [Phyllobacterium sp. 628]